MGTSWVAAVVVVWPGLVLGSETASRAGEELQETSTQPAVLEASEPLQETVRLFFQAVSDAAMAARHGPAPQRARRVDEACQRLRRLAAEQAILEKLRNLLGEKLAHPEAILAGVVDQVIRSWPRILSYYVGRWELQRMVVLPGQAPEGRNVYVPVVDATGHDEAWIELRLVSRESGDWGVLWVGFKRAARQKLRTDVERRAGRPADTGVSERGEELQTPVGPSTEPALRGEP